MWGGKDIPLRDSKMAELRGLSLFPVSCRIFFSGHFLFQIKPYPQCLTTFSSPLCVHRSLVFTGRYLHTQPLLHLSETWSVNKHYC